MNPIELSTKICATLRPPAAVVLAAVILAAVVLATLTVSSVAGAQTPEASSAEADAVRLAERSELFLELRVPSYYPTHESFDALSDNDLYVAGMLGAGYDIGRLTVPGLRAYVLYSGSGTNEERFDGALELGWSRHLFVAAADYGPELFGFVFVRPSARLGAGYALQSLEARAGGAPTDDYAHDMVGMGSVGVELSSPAGVLGPVRLTLLGEVGYQAQTTATFDEMGGSQGDDDPWTRREASFGDLNTNGVFWDLGVGLRIDL